MSVSDDQRKQWMKDQMSSLRDILLEGLMPGIQDARQLARIVTEYQAKFATDKSLAGAGMELGFMAMADILAGFFELLSAFRKETTHTFDPVTASVLTEFLGVDFDPATLATAASKDEVFQKASKIGTLIQDQLEKEFVPTGTVTPESGATAARTFSGYVTNFAVQNAVITLLAGCVPQVHLDDIRELGVEIAQNLGLGRLHRLAMMPLIQNTIQKPYDRNLRMKYRQDLLPATNYVKAYNAGRLTRDQLSQKLGQLGISEDDITELALQLDDIPPLIDLTRLIRHGQMTNDAAVAILENHGWPKDVATQTLQAALLARVDTHVSTYCNLAVKQYVQGFIDEPTFQKLLENAPITDDERQWLSNVAGMELEAGRRRVTFAQLEAGLIAGITDWDYVDTWMAAEGYDQDSQLILQYEILLKLGITATKAQIASGAAKTAAQQKLGQTG